jgi:hybrid cluster-associated redox disulfide protein
MNELVQQAKVYVVTKYDLLGTILQESPHAAELLAEYGLHCINCFANEFDTLEMGAQVHGMSDEEMQEMINEINEQLEKEAKEIQSGNYEGCISNKQLTRRNNRREENS